MIGVEQAWLKGKLSDETLPETITSIYQEFAVSAEDSGVLDGSTLTTEEAIMLLQSPRTTFTEGSYRYRDDGGIYTKVVMTGNTVTATTGEFDNMTTPHKDPKQALEVLLNS